MELLGSGSQKLAECWRRCGGPALPLLSIVWGPRNRLDWDHVFALLVKYVRQQLSSNDISEISNSRYLQGTCVGTMVQTWTTFGAFI